MYVHCSYIHLQAKNASLYRRELHYALDVWARHTLLTFTESYDDKTADIQVKIMVACVILKTSLPASIYSLTLLGDDHSPHSRCFSTQSITETAILLTATDLSSPTLFSPGLGGVGMFTLTRTSIGQRGGRSHRPPPVCSPWLCTSSVTHLACRTARRETP